MQPQLLLFLFIYLLVHMNVYKMQQISIDVKHDLFSQIFIRAQDFQHLQILT